MAILRWLAGLIVMVGTSQVDWLPTMRLKSASDNGEFSVVFTPAEPEEQRTTPHLEVFKNDNSIWTATPKVDISKGASLLVSNDGRFVVTFDPRQPADKLDPVLIFYGRQGQICQFLPHELLEMTQEEFARKFVSADQPTYANRWYWPTISFLASLDGQERFCLWLGRDDRWLAWSLDDGRPFDLNEDLIAECNNKGRSLSLSTMTSDDDESWAGPVCHYFLAARRIPEDRKLFEDLLTQRDRPPIHNILYQKENDPPQHIFRWQRRWMADTLLAIWDKTLTIAEVSDHKQELFWTEKSYLLGSISAKVHLPVAPTKTDGPLWLFLLPATANKTVFLSTEIEQPLRLAHGFLRRDYGKVEEFLMRDFPPGDYLIIAIWDKSVADDEATIPVPGKGDFTSAGRQMITVRAGETTRDVSVDCETEVAAP